jgi:hypothetical protein
MSGIDPPPALQTAAEGQKLWPVFTGLVLALVLAALDQNIVATALPRIVSDLGGLGHLSWLKAGREARTQAEHIVKAKEFVCVQPVVQNHRPPVAAIFSSVRFHAPPDRAERMASDAPASLRADACASAPAARRGRYPLPAPCLSSDLLPDCIGGMQKGRLS